MLLQALCRELLDKICEELLDIEPQDDSSKSLISLARTCKALQDPALNAFYADITDVKSIFMMLPSDAWIIEDDALALTRTLQLSDWESFHRNSHRVRQFSQSNEPFDVEDAALNAACLCPHAPLFPNLRRLFWRNTDSCPGNFIRLLFGPNVTELILLGISRTFYPLVSVMSVTCHNLNDLSISLGGREDAEAMRGVVEEVIPRMPKLQRLYLDFPASISVLQKAEKLPSLRELIIRSLTDSDLSPTSHDHTFSFVGLRKLCIRQSLLANVAKTLDRVGPWPAADSFACHLSTSDSARELESIIQSLSSNFVPAHLSAVRLVAQRTAAALGDNHLRLSAVKMQSLEPLMSYINLEQLVIRTHVPPSLDDADIMTIASAFRKLRVFNLGGCIRLHGHKRPSLRGLAHLVDICPLLEEVHLSIDAYLYRDLPHPTSNSGSNQKITTLDLGCSPIKEATYVFSFLSLLLPKLRAVQTTEYWDADSRARQQSEKFKEQWAQVNHLLCAFQTRKQLSIRWSRNGRDD